MALAICFRMVVLPRFRRRDDHTALATTDRRDQVDQRVEMIPRSLSRSKRLSGKMGVKTSKLERLRAFFRG
jgi:hypothetical protein